MSVLKCGLTSQFSAVVAAAALEGEHGWYQVKLDYCSALERVTSGNLESLRASLGLESMHISTVWTLDVAARLTTSSVTAKYLHLLLCKCQPHTNLCGLASTLDSFAL